MFISRCRQPDIAVFVDHYCHRWLVDTGGKYTVGVTVINVCLWNGVIFVVHLKLRISSQDLKEIEMKMSGNY